MPYQASELVLHGILKKRDGSERPFWYPVPAASEAGLRHEVSLGKDETFYVQGLSMPGGMSSLNNGFMDSTRKIDILNAEGVSVFRHPITLMAIVRFQQMGGMFQRHLPAEIVLEGGKTPPMVVLTAAKTQVDAAAAQERGLYLAGVLKDAAGTLKPHWYVLDIVNDAAIRHEVKLGRDETFYVQTLWTSGYFADSAPDDLTRRIDIVAEDVSLFRYPTKLIHIAQALSGMVMLDAFLPYELVLTAKTATPVINLTAATMHIGQ